MTLAIHLISTVISIIATFGAFTVWILRHMDRHMDRRFAEVQRQFAEARADTQRQFAEAKADTQRQFAEFRTEMWRGFEQAREDRLRLEKKMEDRFDVHGEQIANLRQDVGRLQGIVERTHQPRRFTASSAQSALSMGDEVRETRMPYDTGSGEEDAGRGEEDPG